MKEEVVKYEVGQVVYDIKSKDKVTILYGPFNKQYNYFYEVENSKNKVYKLNSKEIRELDLIDIDF